MDKKINKKTQKPEVTRSEEGFVLPVTLGLGVIMFLAGTTMIIRSQGEQVSAQAQKATATSLSSAEAGITRIQDFLNDNRILAMYPLKGNPSWENPTNIPGQTCSSFPTAEVSRYTSTNWQNIDNNKSQNGQFQVVDYRFISSGADPNTAPPGTILGHGELRLGGRVNATTSAVSENQKVSTARNQLKVRIPVKQTAPDSIPFPGLWVEGGDMAPNNTVSGNLMVSGCSAEIGGNITGQRTAAPTVSFPDLPPKPTSSYNDLRNQTISSGGKTEVQNGVLRGESGSLTFPSSTVGQNHTTEGGVKVYRYTMNGINIGTGGSNITISTDANTKVIFYVDGNINTGSKELTHNNVAQPAHFQIYAYGNNGIPSPDTSLHPHICMNGSGSTYGFIFAPDYNIGIAGSGGSAGFIGSIWARQWNPKDGGLSSCGSSTSNTVVTQTVDWSALENTLLPKGVPPTLAPVSQWEREEGS